jgi:hypothetical protein
MTRASQKEAERRHVERFVAGFLDGVSVEPSERPDFWLRRTGQPGIGLEVTEYHPAAQRAPEVRRKEIESRWRQELWAELDRAGRARPSLHGLQVFLEFKNPRLPRRADQAGLAEELLRLVESLVPVLSERREVKVSFVPRQKLANCPLPPGFEWTFLPEEDWPRAAEHIDWLSVTHYGLPFWLPWHCPSVDAAFVGPEPDEFSRIMEGKARKAAGYSPGDSPLWLLVICDTVGDVQSNIYPSFQGDWERLLSAVRATGFDFGASPFQEVWLFSATTGGRARLHPSGN